MLFVKWKLIGSHVNLCSSVNNTVVKNYILEMWRRIEEDVVFPNGEGEVIVTWSSI
jgi:hypothetical protein